MGIEKIFLMGLKFLTEGCNIFISFLFGEYRREMKPYVVNLSLKLVSFIYLCLCICLFIYSKKAEDLLISAVLSILIVSTVYTLSKVVEKALTKQFSIFYFIIHYLIVVLLIILSSFISACIRQRALYIVILLISYPIALIISFGIAYVYSKKLSREVK